MKTVCLGLALLVSIASAQLGSLRRFPSALRLGNIDDIPYTLRGPFARGIRRAPRLINPLRLDDDNDWLRSGSLLRRTSSPLSRLGFNNGRNLWEVRRNQLASRGLGGRLRRGSPLGDEISIMGTARRGLRRGLFLDDDDTWTTSVMNRGRRLASGGLFGRLRGDDDDNWTTSVMNRGRRLARGGLFGRMRGDDGDNWATSVMNRGRSLARRGLFDRMRGDDDDNWATSVMNRGRRLSGGLLGGLRGDDEDNNWRSPFSRSRGAMGRIFSNPWINNDDDNRDRPERLGLKWRTSLRPIFGSNDDDNNNENMFGRRELSNGLQGLRNAAAPLRLDNNDDNVISPLLPPTQLNLDDDDDDRFSSLSSLRSSLGGPLGGRRFF
ncbi:uncharacterized protein LOC128180062 isoform X2 [Crassostrea angulata]|nr:uncharacterized protein LOC128180062 isoform X2 [Crassostrea angulata]